MAAGHVMLELLEADGVTKRSARGARRSRRAWPNWRRCRSRSRPASRRHVRVLLPGRARGRLRQAQRSDAAASAVLQPWGEESTWRPPRARRTSFRWPTSPGARGTSGRRSGAAPPVGCVERNRQTAMLRAQGPRLDLRGSPRTPTPFGVGLRRVSKIERGVGQMSGSKRSSGWRVEPVVARTKVRSKPSARC